MKLTSTSPQNQATSDDDNDDIDAALNDLQVPINSSCVHLLINTFNKGVNFLRNCGAAWVGEYFKIIEFYQLSW